MVQRLPIPGQDDETWGTILNSFLEVAHNADGTLQGSAVTNAGGITSNQVGSANGIASLNNNGLVPSSQLGNGTFSNSNFLRGDGTWAVPNNGSSSLASDTDVAIVSPSNNQVLTYNSSAGKWENLSPPVTSVFGRAGIVTAQPGDYTAAQVTGALVASNNLSDITNASTARTSLGLGTAATQNKVTAGTAGVLDATDATTTNSRTPIGSAGGDLSGTYPSPTVAKLNGITAPASAPAGSGQVLTSTSTSASAWQTPASAPVSTVFGRTGTVIATNGDYTAAQVTNAADKSSVSTQTFTGNVSSPAVVVSGLTGAVAASRYVGATASGAPTSGTFVVGDYAIDQTGTIWVCITAGTPGTWASLASLAGAAFVGYVAPAVVTLTFASSILVNAALGNVFAVTLTANIGTLANPTNATHDGQPIRIRVIQGTGGSFTLSYGNAWDFGAAGTPTLSTAAGTVDYLVGEYNASKSKWCVSSALGF
jgi:hypothetical protein